MKKLTIFVTMILGLWVIGLSQGTDYHEHMRPDAIRMESLDVLYPGWEVWKYPNPNHPNINPFATGDGKPLEIYVICKQRNYAGKYNGFEMWEIRCPVSSPLPEESKISKIERDIAVIKRRQKDIAVALFSFFKIPVPKL